MIWSRDPKQRQSRECAAGLAACLLCLADHLPHHPLRVSCSLRREARILPTRAHLSSHVCSESVFHLTSFSSLSFFIELHLKFLDSGTFCLTFHLIYVCIAHFSFQSQIGFISFLAREMASLILNVSHCFNKTYDYCI